MKTLPGQPFQTKDFSPKGGGIDFLGLRWVNLTILGRDLVPELNNRTADMGTFFLGAWIPWKFRQLCREADYTEKNYRSFREKAEVAFSLALDFRDNEESPVAGVTRNRVKAPTPELSEHAKRWACFLARQYQRYALELFLWCFESGIKYGSRSVEESVEYWAERDPTGRAILERTFYDVMKECAGSLLKRDDLKTSEAWIVAFSRIQSVWSNWLGHNDTSLGVGRFI